MVIDAHLHLWDKQLGRVGENKVVDFQYELCQSQRMRGYTGVY